MTTLGHVPGGGWYPVASIQFNNCSPILKESKNFESKKRKRDKMLSMFGALVC